MINIYESEAIIKSYRLLRKKCEAIDKFIQNHALYFGPCSADYGSLDVCNNIIDLMTRKNQLINLKIVVDKAIETLSDRAKKILHLKKNYNLSMAELCGILELKERTGFRWVEKSFEELTEALNKSKFINKLTNILHGEDWLVKIVDDVKERRLAYKPVQVSSL